LSKKNEATKVSFDILSRTENISIYTGSMKLNMCKKLSLICTNLKELTFQGCNIDDNGLSFILNANNHCLKKLILMGCDNIEGIKLLQ
jgi:hypothetical protein